MAQWTLTDNSGGAPVVMTFDINPVGFEPPGRDATIESQSTTAPNGQHIFFQGKDQIPTASFEGAVNTQTFFDTLNIWKDKSFPLVLTDDEGRSWTILFKGWKWTRIKRRSPNRWDYTAEVFVLS